MSSHTDPAVRRWPGRPLSVVFVAALVGISAWMWYSGRPVPLPAEISRLEYHDTQQTFRERYRRNPSHIDVCSFLGEIAAQDDRLPTALACFRQIPTTDQTYGASARLQEAQVLLRLNRATAAEHSFHEFLDASGSSNVPPEQVIVAYKRLIYILSVQLRFEERRLILEEMHASGIADVFDSKQLHFPTLLIWNSVYGRNRLQQFLKEDPRNYRFQVAQGRYLTGEGKLTEAPILLEELQQQNPTDRECLAALLECHYERNDWMNFSKVMAAVPAFHADEPTILTRFRGEWADHERDWTTAVLHFDRVQQVDPANPWAQMGLARAYAGLQRTSDREQALQRSLVLSKIRVNLTTVKEGRPQAALDLAKLCDQAGLKAAAQTFRRHAQRMTPAH